MGWSKPKTFAEKIAHGDLSFESVVKVLEEAIAYGRAQERAAIERRVRRAYRENDYWGDLAGPEILGSVLRAIHPE